MRQAEHAARCVEHQDHGAIEAAVLAERGERARDLGVDLLGLAVAHPRRGARAPHLEREALAKILLGRGARERARDHLAGELEPIHDRVRPASRRRLREDDVAEHARAVHERDADDRPYADVDERAPQDVAARGHLGEVREHDGVARGSGRPRGRRRRPRDQQRRERMRQQN